MAAASTLGYYYYSYFSRPRADRILYRELKRKPAARILELGVASGARASRLIRVAQRFLGSGTVHYTGIDLFEARGDGSGLALKDAYRLLKSHGAAVQLIPGDPYSALSRSANSLLGMDLIVISLDQDAESLSRAWKFVPRMLHAETRVFLEQSPAQGTTRFAALPSGQINQLASASRISTRPNLGASRRAA